MLPLIVVMWASLAAAFPLAKMILALTTPAFAVAFRMILSGLVLLGYCWMTGLLPKKRLSGSDLFGLLQVALFNIYLAFVLEFWSLQYIDSLKVNFMYASTPFWSALMGWFLVNEKMSFRKAIAMLIGLSGMIPLILSSTGSEAGFSSLFSFSVPEFVLLVGILSATYAWFAIKKMIDRGLAVPFVNGVGMMVGGTMSLVQHSVTYSGPSPLFPVSNVSMFIILVVGLILATNIIFYNLYAYLLRFSSYTYLSFTGFLSPIFGTIYGMVLFSESFKYFYVSC